LKWLTEICLLANIENIGKLLSNLQGVNNPTALSDL